MDDFENRVSEIKRLHSKQIRLEGAEEIGELADYYNTCYPNDAVYFVDCSTATVEQINGQAEKTLNLPGFRINDVSSLYEHARRDFLPQLVDFCSYFIKTLYLSKTCYHETR